MLAVAVIVFREVLEAALVVGIVLAASRGVPRRARPADRRRGRSGRRHRDRRRALFRAADHPDAASLHGDELVDPAAGRRNGVASGGLPVASGFGAVAWQSLGYLRRAIGEEP